MEKHGYPNPNYTEQDIITGKVTEEDFLEFAPLLVTINTDQYEELVRKSERLEILSNVMKAHGTVDSEVLVAVLGNEIDEAVQAAKNDMDYTWKMYKELKTKHDALLKTLDVARMEGKHE